MVIGFDGSRAFQNDRTGTENYSYQLLKALAKIDKKNKYLVYVIPSETRNLPPSSTTRPWKIATARQGGPRNDKGDWPKNFQFKTINWFRFWTQGGLALQTFRDKLDVLFVPAHILPVIRRPNLKTVVTVHDLGSEYLPSMHQVKQRLYLGFMQKVQLKTASRIIAVSKATKADLIKRVGIDPKKIRVVYEGYDKDKFKMQKVFQTAFGRTKIKNDVLVNSLRRYGLKHGEYFLFVGTVQPRKNLERLIRAFGLFLSSRGAKRRGDLDLVKIATGRSLDPRNDEIELVLVGSKGWLADEIYELPKKLGIEDRVKFLGYVPDEDLPVLYSGAVALTFPSLFEGFGLPILEAQASGCPVLTSNVSSMPEVAGKGAVYVNPYKVDDIVKGMVAVMNKELRIKLVRSGYDNVKRFSWEKCARETLEVLEAL